MEAKAAQIQKSFVIQIILSFYDVQRIVRLRKVSKRFEKASKIALKELEIPKINLHVECMLMSKPVGSHPKAMLAWKKRGALSIE